MSVTKNCLRPETAPLTILTFKEDFRGSFMGCHFMGHSGTGLKFSIKIDLKIFKTFFVQFFKKYVKNTYFGPK